MGLSLPSPLPSYFKRLLFIQGVSRVIRFSSQYHHQAWSADQILGAPKVYPQYGKNNSNEKKTPFLLVIILGDIGGAWAQNDRTDNEFIILEFDHIVYPEEIQIYETYNSGGVVKVSVRNGSTGFDFVIRFFSTDRIFRKKEI